MTDPVWAGPYQQCHQTTAAYPVVVAQRLGARLQHLSCSGARIDLGLVNPQPFSGFPSVPAQFGNWTTRQVDVLNPLYVAAKADAVLVQIGANDINFSAIYRLCAFDPSKCTNSSTEMNALLFQPLAALPTKIRNLVADIKAVGQATAGKVPAIVVANYPAPFPPTGYPLCFDMFPFNIAVRGGGGGVGCSTATFSCILSLQSRKPELDLMRGWLLQFEAALEASVAGIEGVYFANLRNVYGSYGGDFHGFCSPDPWVYGIASILLTVRNAAFFPSRVLTWLFFLQNENSKAPFHPTAVGQQQIAREILRVLSTVE